MKNEKKIIKRIESLEENIAYVLKSAAKSYIDFEKRIEYASRKYIYACPECGKLNMRVKKVICLRCDECSYVFNIEIQRAIKESEKENPYLRMSAYPMEDFGYTNGTPRKGNEWKILNVNCLPEIINERCEVQINTIGWNESRSYKENDFNLIIKCLLEGAEYRYRKLSTPTKKTHEELALEWIQENFPHSTVKSLLNHAYISGRKSTENVHGL